VRPETGLMARLGRLFARKIAPEMQPEIRFVRIGSVTTRLSRPEDALKISTAWRCVTLLSNTQAALQWEVERVGEDGKRTVQPKNRVAWLLGHEPNPEMGALDFRRTLHSHALLWGNGYAEIQRNNRGEAEALWPIGPDRVEPMRDYDGRLFYQVSNPRGGFSELDPRDVFHVRGPGWDGVRGYSVLEVGATALNGANGMEGFASTYFANGMQPSGVITVPKEAALSEEAFRRLQAEVAEKHQGAANAGKPIILDKGMTWSASSADPEKAQFVDARKFAVTDVCRWFGVPPYLAFDTDEQPRANVETQSREFWQFGLLPWITAFEQEANRKLLNSEWGGLRARMNTDELLRGDYKTLAGYYRTMRQIGVFTVNDVLRMEGMPTIGAEGDVRHMQEQNRPVGEAGGEAGGAAASPAPGANEGADQAGGGDGENG